MRATMLVRASVLAITLALSAVPVWAQSTAGVGGACLELDEVPPLIHATALIPLVGVRLTMPNPNGLWHCVTNCSVQANNPGGIRAQLALRVDGDIDRRTERNFELTHDPDPGDADYVEVSTGGITRDLRGGIHSFECAARKLVEGPNFSIPRACMTIVCSEIVLHSEEDVSD